MDMSGTRKYIEFKDKNVWKGKFSLVLCKEIISCIFVLTDQFSFCQKHIKATTLYVKE